MPYGVPYFVDLPPSTLPAWPDPQVHDNLTDKLAMTAIHCVGASQLEAQPFNPLHHSCPAQAFRHRTTATTSWHTLLAD
jgi:hypothetical protein